MLVGTANVLGGGRLPDSRSTTPPERREHVVVFVALVELRTFKRVPIWNFVPIDDDFAAVEHPGAVGTELMEREEVGDPGAASSPTHG